MVAPLANDLPHFGSPYVAFVSVFLALSKIDGLVVWWPIACPRICTNKRGGDL